MQCTTSMPACSSNCLALNDSEKGLAFQCVCMTGCYLKNLVQSVNFEILTKCALKIKLYTMLPALVRSLPCQGARKGIWWEIWKVFQSSRGRVKSCTVLPPLFLCWARMLIMKEDSWASSQGPLKPPLSKVTASRMFVHRTVAQAKHDMATLTPTKACTDPPTFLLMPRTR